MILNFVLVALNAVFSLIGFRFVKLITLEITPIAISILALQGSNIILNALALVLIYTIFTYDDIFGIPPKFTMAVVAGYVALISGSALMGVFAYYVGMLIYWYITGQLGPPSPAYVAIGLGQNYFLLKIFQYFV